MTAIIDYGVGNLFSIARSLQYIGQECTVTGDIGVIRKADRVILPGVGAFGDAAERLAQTGLDEIVKQIAADGTPLLGICLGMQLLLESSDEYGFHSGLGLIKGNIRPIKQLLSPESTLKIPQMGWNSLRILKKDCPILKNTADGDYMYFVHSYCATDCPSVAADTEYGADIPAVVWNRNVFGCQFHPEKSGPAGLEILKAFCEVSAC